MVSLTQGRSLVLLKGTFTDYKMLQACESGNQSGYHKCTEAAGEGRGKQRHVQR